LSSKFPISSGWGHIRLDSDKVKEIVLQTMTESLRTRAVFYIDEATYPKGAEFVVGRNHYLMSSDTIMVFIDEEPGKNWGHNCRYLFFDVDSGEVREIREQFPPSLTRIAKTFKVIWKPSEIPDWAVLK